MSAPAAYAVGLHLADVLTRIVNGHLARDIDDLLPWAYAEAPPLKDAARKQRLRWEAVIPELDDFDAGGRGSLPASGNPILPLAFPSKPRGSSV